MKKEKKENNLKKPYQVYQKMPVINYAILLKFDFIFRNYYSLNNFLYYELFIIFIILFII